MLLHLSSNTSILEAQTDFYSKVSYLNLKKIQDFLKAAEFTTVILVPWKPRIRRLWVGKGEQDRRWASGQNVLILKSSLVGLPHFFYVASF